MGTPGKEGLEGGDQSELEELTDECDVGQRFERRVA